MITAVALSPALDVGYRVERAVGIQRPYDVRRVAGGKALNAARAAARLGADVAAVALLGGPVGELVAQLAAADGLALQVVAAVEPTRTCVSIHPDVGEAVEVYEKAVPASPREVEAVVAAVGRTLAARPGWCLVSGGMPGAFGADALAALLHQARSGGARVAVDTHGAALVAALADPPDLVKVNRDEAAEALGAAAGATAEDLAAALHETTGVVCVVTDGTAGAVAADRSGPRRVALASPVGRYPVGSGDSFLGGLVVSLDNGEDLDLALCLASGAAAANAQELGAAVFDPALARDLAARGAASYARHEG